MTLAEVAPESPHGRPMHSQARGDSGEMRVAPFVRGIEIPIVEQSTPVEHIATRVVANQVDNGRFSNKYERQPGVGVVPPDSEAVQPEAWRRNRTHRPPKPANPTDKRRPSMFPHLPDL